MVFARAGLFVAVLALAGCSNPPPAQENGATGHGGDHAAAESAAPVVRASGTGEVVVVSPADGAVTVRHEAIPEYGMGAMTMEFTTENKAQLNGVAVGDQVTFELKGPTDIDTITVVKK